MELNGTEKFAVDVIARGLAKDECFDCFDVETEHASGLWQLEEERTYYLERARVAVESMKAAGLHQIHIDPGACCRNDGGF